MCAGSCEKNLSATIVLRLGTKTSSTALQNLDDRFFIHSTFFSLGTNIIFLAELYLDELRDRSSVEKDAVLLIASAYLVGSIEIFL